MGKGENLLTGSFKIALILVALGCFWAGAGDLGWISGAAVSNTASGGVGVFEIVIGLLLVAVIILPKLPEL